MKQHFDCIIVGSGIAGITAAIYLKRANKNVLLIEKYMPGGQINKTSNVENYPGFKKIDGPSLVMNLVEQLNNLEIKIKYEEVIDIKKDNYFSVETKKDIYSSETLILAGGRNPNMLGLENEQEYIGKGISYCALCDGNLFRNKKVVIVGGGNSAFEESLYLANLCEKITIINRSETLKATMILQEEVRKAKNIEILYNNEIKKINTENDLIKSIDLKDRTIECEGIFIYIGSTPNLELTKNLNISVSNNYINVDSNMKTNIDKLYACGDITNKNVYQIVTAASDGAIAATSALRDMEK